MAEARQRLDAALVQRQMVASRTEAARAVDAHRVRVNGVVALKVSRQVHPHDDLVLIGEAPQYVSRGGDKLAAALDHFELDVADLRVLDVGASTGGFTDCLLQRGAAHVVAIDVGRGQLHARLGVDPRVSSFERLHVRDLDVQRIGGAVDAVVADVSFISLTRVFTPAFAVCVPGAPFVFLVKPQFEAGRQEVSRGHGVITDQAIHERVCAEIDEVLVNLGCTVRGWIPSPLYGADGNREFLVCGAAPTGVAER